MWIEKEGYKYRIFKAMTLDKVKKIQESSYEINVIVRLDRQNVIGYRDQQNVIEYLDHQNVIEYLDQQNVVGYLDQQNVIDYLDQPNLIDKLQSTIVTDRMPSIKAIVRIAPIHQDSIYCESIKHDDKEF